MSDAFEGVDTSKAEEAAANKLKEFGIGPEEEPVQRQESGQQTDEPQDGPKDIEDFEPEKPTKEIVDKYKEESPEDGTEEPSTESSSLDQDMYLAGEAVGLTREQLDARIRARGLDAVKEELDRAREGILGEVRFLHEGAQPGASHGFMGPQVPQGPVFGQPPATGQQAPGTQPAAPAGQPAAAEGKSLADLTDEQIQEAREEYGDLYADNLERMRNDARLQRDFIIRQQQAEQQRQIEELDRWYDEAAKEGYAEAFGESRQKATPEQLRMREQVLMTAAGIRQAHLARGQDISPRAAWSRAVLAVASDMRRDSARRQVEEQVTKRSQAIGLPPSVPGSGRRNTGGKKMPPEVKAVQAIEQWYRERGLPVPED